MKKKIKDLTLEETNKICTSSSKCKSCHLQINKLCLISMIGFLKEQDLNKEIEVEEEYGKNQK